MLGSLQNAGRARVAAAGGGAAAAVGSKRPRQGLAAVAAAEVSEEEEEERPKKKQRKMKTEQQLAADVDKMRDQIQKSLAVKESFLKVTDHKGVSDVSKELAKVSGAIQKRHASTLNDLRDGVAPDDVNDDFPQTQQMLGSEMDDSANLLAVTRSYEEFEASTGALHESKKYVKEMNEVEPKLKIMKNVKEMPLVFTLSKHAASSYVHLLEDEEEYPGLEEEDPGLGAEEAYKELGRAYAQPGVSGSEVYTKQVDLHRSKLIGKHFTQVLTCDPKDKEEFALWKGEYLGMMETQLCLLKDSDPALHQQVKDSMAVLNHTEARVADLKRIHARVTSDEACTGLYRILKVAGKNVLSKMTTSLNDSNKKDEASRGILETMKPVLTGRPFDPDRFADSIKFLKDELSKFRTATRTKVSRVFFADGAPLITEIAQLLANLFKDAVQSQKDAWVACMVTVFDLGKPEKYFEYLKKNISGEVIKDVERKSKVVAKLDESFKKNMRELEAVCELLSEAFATPSDLKDVIEPVAKEISDANEGREQVECGFDTWHDVFTGVQVGWSQEHIVVALVGDIAVALEEESGFASFRKTGELFEDKHRENLTRYMDRLEKQAIATAKKGFKAVEDTLEKATLEKAEFWTWQEGSSFLPMMLKDTAERPDEEAMQDAGLLAAKFQDEKYVVDVLKKVADFTPYKKFESHIASVMLSKGRVETAKAQVARCLEEARVAAAKYLVLLAEAGTKGTLPATCFLEAKKATKPGGVVLEYEAYHGKPALESAIMQFSTKIQACRKYLKALESASGTKLKEDDSRVKVIVEADDLFADKTKDVFTGMMSSFDRVCGSLRGYLTPNWLGMVEADNVGEIKKKLIGNPSHGLVSPVASMMRTELEKVQNLLPVFKRDYQSKLSMWQTCIHDAYLQLGAVSLCVATYVTKTSNALPETRKKSMQGAKRLCTLLDIHLPQVVIRKYELALLEVDGEEKAAKLQAAGGKKATGKPRRGPDGKKAGKA